MYWRRFNLTGEPFSLTPDPAFLFFSPVHAEAFAALKVGLQERRGLITMIGEVGTGKTTLVYSLLSNLGPEVHTAYISNPRISFDSMLRTAMRDFGAKHRAKNSAALLTAFNEFLQRCAHNNTTAALVIDEAQNLSNETFEDLRLLSNFETYKHKLLQIILVGQPELDVKLRDPSLRQVAERVAVRCHVNPLTAQQSRQYIEHRLASVGGSTHIFTEAALRLIIRRSRGIPRTLNILCHNAMLFAFGVGKERVTRSMAVEAIAEKEGRGLVRLRSPLSGWLPSTGRYHNYSILSKSRAATIAGIATAAALTGLIIAPSTPQPEAVAPLSTPATPTAEPRDIDFSAVNHRSLEQPVAVYPQTRTVIEDTPFETTPHEIVDDIPRPGALDDLERMRAAAWAKTHIPEDVLEPPRQDTTPSVWQSDPAPTQVVVDETFVDEIEVAPVVKTQSEFLSETSSTPQEQQRNDLDTAQPAEPQAAHASAILATEQHQTEQPQEYLVGTQEIENDTAPAVPETDAPSVGEVLTAVNAPEAMPTDDDDTLIVHIEQGRSLSGLLVALYGRYSTDLVGRIKELNPHITDPNMILAGDTLRFPTSRSAIVVNDEESR